MNQAKKINNVVDSWTTAVVQLYGLQTGNQHLNQPAEFHVHVDVLQRLNCGITNISSTTLLYPWLSYIYIYIYIYLFIIYIFITYVYLLYIFIISIIYIYIYIYIFIIYLLYSKYQINILNIYLCFKYVIFYI